MNPEEKHHDHRKNYFYFVDGEKYESDEAHTTGAIIKSKLPESKRGYALFLIEGHGDHHHHHLIHDDTKVSLEHEKEPKQFCTKDEHPKEKYIYFVDGVKYESDEANTTGAIIKSKLPEAKRAYALYLEGNGKEPDLLINNDTTVSFEKDKPKRFYTVPPASFGLE